MNCVVSEPNRQCTKCPPGKLPLMLVPISKFSLWKSFPGFFPDLISKRHFPKASFQACRDSPGYWRSPLLYYLFHPQWKLWLGFAAPSYFPCELAFNPCIGGYHWAQVFLVIRGGLDISRAGGLRWAKPDALCNEESEPVFHMDPYLERCSNRMIRAYSQLGFIGYLPMTGSRYTCRVHSA